MVLGTSIILTSVFNVEDVLKPVLIKKLLRFMKEIKFCSLDKPNLLFTKNIVARTYAIVNSGATLITNYGEMPVVIEKLSN